MALVQAIATKRLKQEGQQTDVEQAPRYSSQSLGGVGASQRILQGQTRTLRVATEAAYTTKVGPQHVAWPWLTRHAAFIMEMFHVKGTGTTPHQDAVGSKYKGSVLKFA